MAFGNMERGFNGWMLKMKIWNQIITKIYEFNFQLIFNCFTKIFNVKKSKFFFSKISLLI